MPILMNFIPKLSSTRTALYRTGIRFIKQLKERYGDTEIALSHYNGGSRVKGKDGSLRVIPATRGYVDKVLAKAEGFRSLHPSTGTKLLAGAIKKVGSNVDFYLSMADKAIGPSYRDMQNKAKNVVAEQLYDLREKNARLASVVRSTVDPYLNRYTGNRSDVTSTVKHVSPSRKRALVLEWESIY